MPFVRFSRDKRGYEHMYLVQPASQRRGRSTARVLYWFRTPPNIRVGRRPLDEFARRELERRYPDVSFDWEALANTPIPPPAPDVEKWRERRRQERASRQAARAEAEAAAAGAEADESGEETGEPATVSGESESAEPAAPRSAAEAAIEAAQAVDEAETDAGASQDESSSSPADGGPASTARSSRRRRRRRHHGSRRPTSPGPGGEPGGE